MAYTLILDAQEIEDLAAGCCPRSVQALARFALESDEARLARNALRPVRTTTKTKKKPVRAAERERLVDGQDLREQTATGDK